MAGTAVTGAVAHLLATAIEEGRDLSSMSGILAGTACYLLLA
jgi:homoserine dehydrogenase